MTKKWLSSIFSVLAIFLSSCGTSPEDRLPECSQLIESYVDSSRTHLIYLSTSGEIVESDSTKEGYVVRDDLTYVAPALEPLKEHANLIILGDIHDVEAAYPNTRTDSEFTYSLTWEQTSEYITALFKTPGEFERVSLTQEYADVTWRRKDGGLTRIIANTEELSIFRVS